MEIIVREPGECPFVDTHRNCGLSTTDHVPICNPYMRDIPDDCPLRSNPMTIKLEK